MRCVPRSAVPRWRDVSMPARPLAAAPFRCFTPACLILFCRPYITERKASSCFAPRSVTPPSGRFSCLRRVISARMLPRRRHAPAASRRCRRQPRPRPPMMRAARMRRFAQRTGGDAAGSRALWADTAYTRCRRAAAACCKDACLSRFFFFFDVGCVASLLLRHAIFDTRQPPLCLLSPFTRRTSTRTLMPLIV